MVETHQSPQMEQFLLKFRQAHAKAYISVQCTRHYIVVMFVQDDNDNSPLFEQTTYTLNITEGTLIGTQILTVVANDIDDGPNGVIRYSILMAGPDYQQFAIDQMSGILSTNKDFDFDTEKDTYSIDVMNYY